MGVGVSEALVGLGDEASVGGRGMAGDLGASGALAALGTIDFKLGDVNGQAKCFQFQKALVHGVEGDRRVEVRLGSDGREYDPDDPQATGSLTNRRAPGWYPTEW